MADREQAVVAQDDGLAVAELVRDALAFLEIEHHAGVLVEQGVVVVERAGVLGDRVEQPGERGPRLAVHRMGMRGADHVRAGGMDLRMDGERGLVQRSVALDDRAVMAHQQQVAHPDVPEVHAERIDPEVIGQLRIACGDVARDALVEAEAAEQAERRRQVLFAVQTLLFDRAALLRQKRRNVAARESACLFDIGVSHGRPQTDSPAGHRTHEPHARKRSTYGANGSRRSRSSRPNISGDVATVPSLPR